MDRDEAAGSPRAQRIDQEGPISDTVTTRSGRTSIPVTANFQVRFKGFGTTVVSKQIQFLQSK